MLLPYSLIRPALFALDPEKAHHVTFSNLQMLRKVGLLKALSPSAVSDPVKVMGIEFPNRVGLAAGLDKDAAYISELGLMGFGFLEVGTVTPKPQPGNPKPRLFRLPQADALINRMGFNNEGVDTLIRNVKASNYPGVLGINIGKNAATPVEQAADDYLKALEAVYPYATYITVNISSPNTKNLRDLQGGDSLDILLGSLKEKQKALADEHGLYKPMALKIAPDLDDAQIDAIAQRLTHFGFDGVIATNTTIDKSSVSGLAHGDEQGGLSGAPVLEKSTHVIKRLYSELGDDVPIIGVGGISSGEHAVEKIRAGAKLVQIYTGLIYKGPALVTECAATIRLNCKRKAHANRT
ncbi:dihydroorotate oxidase A [Limnobacter thiooxidans]|uniref:Dihydroorotate dehydrogenase (quinone) n=1 Tax=Limnobacter thiooxidans TaxID=131080 RepID=A0AA86J319_9BURK|nr:quinone-dependent dihydroorotate dehydrogenase [Limnobacter sp.]MCZ8015314.1 quinone-dependent dihydroorotate dehydrogenase [Limnobacter sp.]RZS42397.1 dihydroorotate oxidase A [Limnobacter thiooxidans]BET26169.1 quinone-dependent dihydroorotate dehydrogenase [Limnobacter thiooxidans]